jgi:hypothetical protein
MRKVIHVAMCASFCWLLLLCACGLDPLAGGTSTSENGMIAGVIVDSSGVPQKNTRVTLLPADYDRVRDSGLVKSRVDTTDISGGFAFSHVDSGSYSIQARSITDAAMLLISTIAVRGDTAICAPSALEAPGMIRVTPPDSQDARTVYVYIPGTDIAAYFSSPSDTLALGSVPAGTIPALCFGHKGSREAPYARRFNIAVSSGDTTLVVNTSWRYAQTLYLNTAPSGAAIAGNVFDFPVLVRLTWGMFDFSEAAPSGADIRFVKPDGAPLQYEIERWDAANGNAEIWVRVDTIRGNNENQHILMYWGNAAAADFSRGSAVFDTVAGFQGVWHLCESSGNLVDATLNRFNGSRIGNQAQVLGDIGYGQGFDGSGDYTEMGNVGNPGNSNFTVCAWVKRSITMGYRTIIAKSVGDAPSPSYGWLVELGPNGSLLVFMATDTGEWGGARTFVLGSKVCIVDTVAWHHIAVAIDRSGNNNCRVYIDGADVSDLPAGGDITGIGRVVNSVPLRIGSDAKGGGQWKGFLDECSFAFKVRSPDWVKLCYMNQKADDKLVFFRTNANK